MLRIKIFEEVSEVWMETINRISSKYVFKDPASGELISSLEDNLNVQLPCELKNLLCETDGVIEKHDFAQWSVIWSSKVIIEENLQIRNNQILKENYMPFENLLFFADAGNGDLFGYFIIDKSAQKDAIYVWNHEDDSPNRVASSLKEFIEGWLGGSISI